MPTWEPDRREWIAIALGLAVAAALAWFLFGLVGWLGVGLVGLIGLMISSRVALDDGRAVPDSRLWLDRRRHPGPTNGGRASHSAEQRAGRWAEQEKRSAIVYFVNTIAMALAALGFTLFVMHQL